MNSQLGRTRGRLLVVAILCSLIAVGCTDPGCIRNSECGDGFECREALCVRESTGEPAHVGFGDDADASTE